MGRTGLSYKHMAVHTVCLPTAVYSSCTHISPVTLYKTYIILILHGQVVNQESEIAVHLARSPSRGGYDGGTILVSGLRESGWV